MTPGSAKNRTSRTSILGRPRLPEGIISLAFTDVVGSTAIVRALGEASARSVLRRHEAIVRAAL